MHGAKYSTISCEHTIALSCAQKENIVTTVSVVTTVHGDVNVIVMLCYVCYVNVIVSYGMLL